MVAETFEKLVKTMAEQKASDLFLTVGLPVLVLLNWIYLSIYLPDA